MGACYCYYSRSLSLMMEIFLACTQDYRRDGPDDDRVAGEPTEGGYDGDCDQRTNYFECLSDGEGEDAAENWAILAGRFSVFPLLIAREYISFFVLLATLSRSL